MLMKGRILAFFLLVLFSASVRADDPPQWLVEASKLTVPSYEIKDVPAAVLRKEENVSVSSDGTVTRTTRYAIKILTSEGKEDAVARAIYETDSEKIKDLNAWLIRKTGPTKAYGKKEAIDMVLSDNDLYNEARVRFVDASKEVLEGDVFGYETVSESKSIFSQFQFHFQYDLPALYSSFNLNLPAGWRAESVTFNTAKVEPAVSGTSYTWELRNLAPIKPEAGSPEYSSLSPRLAVSFFPASPTATQIRTFANWSDVAKWMSEVEDPQMRVDDALAAKTHEITDNLNTEEEKIRAIARYVQTIQYISIQIGTGKGGGYVPHSSTEVFAKSYGDCKDKANLMRAMLSVIKVPAYMVSITADDAAYVRAEWPSPHQFNHCIIAIKVSNPEAYQAVIDHPKLGRLLIFDSTDPYTPIGDLPEDEQGSFALIDHKDTDSLSRMPILSPETNSLDRTVAMALDPDGAISGSISEKSNGQTAAQERSRLRRLSAPEYNRMIEGWIARGVSGAKTSNITTNDENALGKFNLDVDFSAKSYAQIMQGHLMVFKPAVVGRLERLSFTEGTRNNPFNIDSTVLTETVRIKLPPGFVVDEMPDAIQLEAPFGKYSSKSEVVGDSLVFSRSIRLVRTTVPADKYDSVQKFFGRVRGAEQSQVVLVKK